jgi:hypothetical protein
VAGRFRAIKIFYIVSDGANVHVRAAVIPIIHPQVLHNLLLSTKQEFRAINAMDTCGSAGRCVRNLRLLHAEATADTSVVMHGATAKKHRYVRRFARRLCMQFLTTLLHAIFSTDRTARTTDAHF